VQVPGRVHDLDAVEVLEVEQVAVAGDDEVGGGGERAGKHGIIGRIARDRRRDHRRRHERRIAVEKLLRGEPARGELVGELWPCQYVLQFCKSGVLVNSSTVPASAHR